MSNYSYGLGVGMVVWKFNWGCDYCLGVGLLCCSGQDPLWYHWQFGYPFALVPLWKWVYNNPQYVSGYYHSCCSRKWNACLEGGFPPFPSPHLTMSGYPYHQRQLLNLDGHCYCWPDSQKYGATNIDNDNTCNDDGCSREDMIIR